MPSKWFCNRNFHDSTLVQQACLKYKKHTDMLGNVKEKLMQKGVVNSN